MLTVLAILLTAPAADYHWPLDLPRQLSSSFGEYRSGRLHAGIDLRTAGTGREVFAAESGFVERVRCSPYGYGKVVYVRLVDGNTAIYAHLDSFNEPIGEYVRRAQHAKRSYTVDLYPEKTDLPVERGQVIARSGQTGVGVPHLHYEIRDSAGRPINPRDLGIDWPDTTPPTIQAVVIAPLTAGSRVNGDVVPAVLTARSLGPGRYAIDAVSARGTIGVGVQLVDPANGGASKLGVRTLATQLDGAEHFRMTRDRLSYDTLSNGLVAYHPYLYDRGRFLLQWRWPANRSEAFAYPVGDGRIEVGDQAIAGTVTAADFHENAASVEFVVNPSEPDAPLNGADGSTGSGSFELACYGDFLVLTAAFSEPERLVPSLTLDGGAGAFLRIDDKTFRAALEPHSGATRMGIRAEHPRAETYAATVEVFRRGSARSVRFGDAGLSVSSQSPYGILFAQANEPPRTAPLNGLELVTNPVSIWPDNAPIDANVNVSIPLPTGETRRRQLHIYRANRNGWNRTSSKSVGDELAASTRAFGTYAILADETPPNVGPIKITGGAPRPRIVVPVRDTGSGIADYQVTSGGDWLLTAYDPEQDLLIWERDRDLPAAAKSVEVRVTDAAGNTAVERRALP